MANESYLPRTDSELVVWFGNFAAKLASYNTLLNITATELTAVQSDNAALAYMIQQVELAKTNTQDRVAYKDALLDGPIGTTGGAFPGSFVPPAAPAVVVAMGVLPRVRLLVRRIKAHPLYTKSIGEDLRTVRSAVTPVPKNKPKGSAKALPNSVTELKFIKSGADGVYIETKRGNEANWTPLGNFLRSPMLDTRPPLVANQPEQRSYRMQLLKGNDPIGTVSDTLIVTTML